jgi:hypothetical protein
MRAAIAGGLEPCYAAEAKERQRRSGGDRVRLKKWRRTFKKHWKTQRERLWQFCHKRPAHLNLATAAEACDVSSRYVQDAKIGHGIMAVSGACRRSLLLLLD